MSKNILPQWFPVEMEKVLVEKASQNPITWKSSKCKKHHLFGALENQFEHLRHHLSNDNHEKIIRTCVHVANYAMMIADKERRNHGTNI